jgi:hypothetical protein
MSYVKQDTGQENQVTLLLQPLSLMAALREVQLASAVRSTDRINTIMSEEEGI